MDELRSPRPRGRGIYLLPNLFTTGGMFAGFYAIIAATQGHFENACVAIFIAAILDGEWEESDDVVVARVRAWLVALHGASIGAVETGGNGGATGEISGAGR